MSRPDHERPHRQLPRRAAVLAVLVLALSGLAVGDQRINRTTVPITGEADVSALRTADCVYSLRTPLRKVPCDRPHHGEVVGQVAPVGAYPGPRHVPLALAHECALLFDVYAPAAAHDPGLALFLPSASRRQWDDPGFRLPCIAADRVFRTGHLAVTSATR